MTAAIISFATASLRLRIKRAAQSLKPLAKVEPGTASMRDLIRLDTEQVIAELEAEAEFDDDEGVQLFIGPCGEWTTCVGCGNEISPATTISQDLTSGDVHCVRCFHRSGK